MKGIISIKNIIIGIAILLIIAIIVLSIYSYKNYATDNLNPAVKTVFSKIPFLKNTMHTDLVSETVNSNNAFEEEKKMIEYEWSEIDRQKQELQSKEAKLNKKQSELEHLENKLQVDREELENQLMNIKDLAKYYELMDGRNAARILENMEDEFLIQIFKQMKN
ncbi:MAG TPA: magnesium transporter MgtE, partial [Thermoanaerobacterales bacterium]|nr:magnesium transporter MgtE [Thermoanaerobacterales bacterium]